MMAADAPHRPAPVVATFGRDVWVRVVGTLIATVVVQTGGLAVAGLLWAHKVDKRIEAETARNDHQDAAIEALAGAASKVDVDRLTSKVDRLSEQLNQALGELRARGALSPLGGGR